MFGSGTLGRKAFAGGKPALKDEGSWPRLGPGFERKTLFHLPKLLGTLHTCLALGSTHPEQPRVKVQRILVKTFGRTGTASLSIHAGPCLR